jgi:8-oxo-dGTP pyrophosphatase MutT (NUDIX family)
MEKSRMNDGQIDEAAKYPEKMREKVVAYITNGQRLLVFTHPLSPEAGIQVPAGTMKAGETPTEAVLREAEEETGLTDLEIVSFLGQSYLDVTPFGKDEVHHRHFFHLTCPGTPAEQWDWLESDPSDSSDPIPFSSSWVDLSGDIPKLAARQGDFVHLLSGAEGGDR